MSPAAQRARAFEAAGIVGTWRTDTRAGLSVLDRPAATLLAGDGTLGGRPLPLEAALARIHPGDRDWVFARILRVRRTGGPFSAEFRVLDTGGRTRWILNRGSLAPDPDGVMRGRGTYIDTTDSHSIPFTPIALEGPSDLAEAARHALYVHEAVSRSGPVPLRAAAEVLLWEIGRALAADSPS